MELRIVRNKRHTTNAVCCYPYNQNLLLMVFKGDFVINMNSKAQVLRDLFLCTNCVENRLLGKKEMFLKRARILNIEFIESV